MTPFWDKNEHYLSNFMFHHLVSDPQVSTKYGDFEQNYMFFIFILKKVEKSVGCFKLDSLGIG